MMKLEDLQPDPKSRRNSKRLGRGEGSGRGKTCGRGQKGQLSRRGAKVGPHFEGGQMPVQRRLPKFGFTSLNKDRKGVAIINVIDLNHFPEGKEVTIEDLKEKGLVPKRANEIRVLAKGKLKHKVSIKANYFSKSALEKIKEAQGHAELLA